MVICLTSGKCLSLTDLQALAVLIDRLESPPTVWSLVICPYIVICPCMVICLTSGKCPSLTDLQVLAVLIDRLESPPTEAAILQVLLSLTLSKLLPTKT